jgi:hypothetical protein
VESKHSMQSSLVNNGKNPASVVHGRMVKPRRPTPVAMGHLAGIGGATDATWGEFQTLTLDEYNRREQTQPVEFRSPRPGRGAVSYD